MSNTAEYTIGSEVACSDGTCGELSRVVLDPVARVLTHLVVEPRHRRGLGRLVPIGLVEATDAGAKILLRCSTAEFHELEEAEETRFLSEADDQMGYGSGEVFSWPYYGLGMGIGGIGVGGMAMAGTPQLATYDRVPADEVEVRRGERVHASDGDIGRVKGLVIDPSDHHVTHVLLEEGHRWGRRELAIPIGSVGELAPDGVRINLTRAEVRELPAVGLAHGD